MKNTRKISIALVIVMVLMMALAVIPASAAGEQPATLYLTPNANWKSEGARFAAYFFGNGETWVSMTDSDGDGVYEVAVPTDKVYPNVIFCRMNPNAAANNWNNKYNQTADLTIPTGGANHYTVKEGTWDKGGGTWSTFGSTCTHTNLGEAATCTTPQICIDCKDPVVSALGHTFNASHLCTRCNEQASFTVAGSGAHLGTEWDTGNTANDMTYADGVYTKVYTNVAAGSYKFKVARDHDWGTAYPSADKAYKVDVDGSTVTITLKGTTVEVNVVAPHTHVWSDATCTEPQKCECGETQGEALGHSWSDATCTEPQKCACGETQGEALGHTYVEGACSACGYCENHTMEENTFYHPELLAPTCCTPGVAVFECTVCDYYYTEEAPIDPEAHAYWGEREVITAANCAEKINGLVKVACDNGCGTFDEVVIDYTEAHNMEEKINNPATCTTAGEYLAVCTVCGFEEKYSSDANGHSNWYLTCGETGNCMECGVEFTLEHAGDPATCTDPMYCYNCWSSVGEALGHDFVNGVCSRCEEADPDYVANDYLINFSTWAEFGKETYADGDVFKYNDIFTFIYGKNSRVDGSEKTWDDFSGTLRFSFGGKTPTGSVPSKNALQITVDGAYTLKIWYVAGGDARYFALMDSTGAVLSETTKETVKNGQYYAELEIPAAGVYYFGVPADNNYIFQLELVKNEATACEHSYSAALGFMFCDKCYAPNPDYQANNLVAGENKVICNEYMLVGDGQNGNHTFPYQFVQLTLTEDGTYTISGTMLGVTIFTIEVNTEGADFSTNGTSWLVYDIDGTADLKAGTYYIGLIYIAGHGEYTVNVDKAPEHEHNFVEGKCECGEEDPNYAPPHEHEFVEGKCECGAEDPDYVAPVEPDVDEPDVDEPVVEPELNFFQKIWKAIVEFFQKLLGMFSKK